MNGMIARLGTAQKVAGRAVWVSGVTKLAANGALPSVRPMPPDVQLTQSVHEWSRTVADATSPRRRAWATRG
jgi:hypothetical protein